MNIDEAVNAYREYIEEHISNVQKVWKLLQQYLTGEYFLDDYHYHSINSLIWEHDFSKLLSDEFEGYRQYFYPADGGNKDKTQFLRAWNHHIHNNKHHWEYWVMYKKSGSIALDMPFIFIIEMLCDWTAMSMKFSNAPSEWFGINEHKMLLHDSTRTAIDNWIPLFDQIVKDAAL